MLKIYKFYFWFFIKFIILFFLSLKNKDSWRKNNFLKKYHGQLKGRSFFIKSLFNFNNKNPINRNLILGYNDYFTIKNLFLSNFIFVEAGFLRSVLMDGSSNKYDMAKTFIIDQYGPHYAPYINNNLIRILNDKNFKLNSSQTHRVKKLINFITANKITKYNNQSQKFAFDHDSNENILVVEQAADDWAVKFSFANYRTFEKMLNDAIRENKFNSKIFVKLHPDSIDKKKNIKNYYHDQKDLDNVIFISDKINPYSILSHVKKVYTVSSMLGFEALMLGKDVKVYGCPIYAGWGITDDVKKFLLINRNIKRSLEEIFFVIYIRSQVYLNSLGQECEIENFLEDLKNDIKLHEIENSNL